MKTIKFTIMGSPVTWQRVKHNRFTNVSFNDPKMVVYQNRIADCFLEQCRDEPTNNAVYIEAMAFFPIPRTMPKWKRAIAETELLPYDHIPDFDNLLKNIADALQNIAYTNDARVTDGLIRKRYSLRPRMEVIVYFPMPPLKIAPVADPEQLSLFGKEEK